MQISKVRVGRFYMLALRGGGEEKVLAYGILREFGQPPLVTVKDEAGEIEHVKARRLTPIELTQEQKMNTLVAFIDGAVPTGVIFAEVANSPADVDSAHVSESDGSAEAIAERPVWSKPTVVGYTNDGLPLTAEAVSKTLVKSPCGERECPAHGSLCHGAYCAARETPAERTARVYAEAMARS